MTSVLQGFPLRLITSKCQPYVASPSRSSGLCQVLADLVVLPFQLAYKGLQAKAALVRSLPRVCPHMVHEGHLLRESPGAQVALKRSLASVDAEVGVQVATRCEGLLAVVASVRLVGMHIFGGAQVTATSLCERELRSHLVGGRVAYAPTGTALSSGGACKTRQCTSTQELHSMESSAVQFPFITSACLQLTRIFSKVHDFGLILEFMSVPSSLKKNVCKNLLLVSIQPFPWKSTGGRGTLEG